MSSTHDGVAVGETDWFALARQMLSGTEVEPCCHCDGTGELAPRFRDDPPDSCDHCEGTGWVEKATGRPVDPPKDEPIQWVNPERTLLVTLWPGGKVDVATRETPSHTWGPPRTAEPERSAA